MFRSKFVCMFFWSLQALSRKEILHLQNAYFQARFQSKFVLRDCMPTLPMKILHFAT